MGDHHRSEAQVIRLLERRLAPVGEEVGQTLKSGDKLVVEKEEDYGYHFYGEISESKDVSQS